MIIVIDFKGLSERDVEKFVQLFKWKSWCYNALDEELVIEVDAEDVFPRIAKRLKRIAVGEP